MSLEDIRLSESNPDSDSINVNTILLNKRVEELANKILISSQGTDQNEEQSQSEGAGLTVSSAKTSFDKDNLLRLRLFAEKLNKA